MGMHAVSEGTGQTRTAGACFGSMDPDADEDFGQLRDLKVAGLHDAISGMPIVQGR
jgi:hypothetical protein